MISAAAAELARKIGKVAAAKPEGTADLNEAAKKDKSTTGLSASAKAVKAAEADESASAKGTTPRSRRNAITPTSDGGKAAPALAAEGVTPDGGRERSHSYETSDGGRERSHSYETLPAEASEGAPVSEVKQSEEGGDKSSSSNPFDNFGLYSTPSSTGKTSAVRNTPPEGVEELFGRRG
jgi:hypothetical protein